MTKKYKKEKHCFTNCTKASDKFVNRFKEMEEKAASDGKDMAELSAKELDELWEFVKKA